MRSRGRGSRSSGTNWRSSRESPGSGGGAPCAPSLTRALREINPRRVGNSNHRGERGEGGGGFSDDALEERIGPRLAFQSGVRFPSFHDVRSRHLPHEVSLDGTHGGEAAAGSDDGGRVLPPRPVRVVGDVRLDDALDTLLHRIAEIPVVPQAGEPAPGNQHTRRLGHGPTLVYHVERTAKEDRIGAGPREPPRFAGAHRPGDRLTAGILDSDGAHRLVRLDRVPFQAVFQQFLGKFAGAGADLRDRLRGGAANCPQQLLDGVVGVVGALVVVKCVRGVIPFDLGSESVCDHGSPRSGRTHSRARGGSSAARSSSLSSSAARSASKNRAEWPDSAQWPLEPHPHGGFAGPSPPQGPRSLLYALQVRQTAAAVALAPAPT